jgi:hypothetical protein
MSRGLRCQKHPAHIHPCLRGGGLRRLPSQSARRVLLQRPYPPRQQRPLLLGHAGIVADRHIPIQNNLLQDFRGPCPKFLDRFQHDLLRRRIEARMRRLVRVTHDAMLARDRSHLRIGDIARASIGRVPGACGGEQSRRNSRCAHARCGPVQGSRMVDPVVPRPSRSRCAFCASFRAYFWLTGILTAPLATTSNRSLAVLSKSSRLAT